MADSLRKQFFTTAGRPVKDGKGVLPDVAVELPQAADLTASLLSKNHIFDYASDFKRNNETIDSAKEFVMDENQYNDFIAFLEGKDFDYTTRTEQALERLKKASEGDKYYDRISEEYEKLVEKIKSNKDKDLLLHKKEIAQILENEIISRYFYQTGRIEHSLKNDPRVKESISVLNQKQRYKRILAASKK